MTDCDIIVVGAGSAGCVLSARLAAELGRRVILIEPESAESGPTSPADLVRPANWLNLLGSAEDWDLATEPAGQLAGRIIRWPRGRGLGGSSRINAMIWFPPTDGDLRNLCDASGGRHSVADWTASLAEVESIVRPKQPQWLSESSQQFMLAVRDRKDAWPVVYRRVNRNGRRWNPKALLPTGQDRFRIVRAMVDRLLLDQEKVVGVSVRRKAAVEEIRCRGDVILCAGAVGTPTLLMRSGIGPFDVLADAGIERRLDLPRVGAGLQDHLVMPVIFSLNSARRFRPTPSVRDLAHWQTLGGGPLSSNLAECGGLFGEHQAFQIHVTPTHYLSYPQASAPAAMTMAVNVTRPASRGCIAITCPDPAAAPIIETGYLSDETDLQATIRGVRLCREIADTAPLSRWHVGEQLPGTKRESDHAIAKSISRYARTLYHPVGTCAMGSDDGAVVDSSFRLRGIQNLRIADASILPQITQGNPNATVMTIAWRCAQEIKADPFY